MTEASGGEPKRRGRPAGSTNKPKVGRAAARAKPPARPKKPAKPAAKRGRKPNPAPTEPPTPLARAPLMLPPPSYFSAEIILPSGESYFDGEPTPTDEDVRAAAGGGKGGDREPPKGPRAAADRDAEDAILGGRRGFLAPDRETLLKVWNIACGGHTRPEAAAMLRVSLPTFNRFLAGNPIANDLWHDGLLIVRASVRSKIVTEVMKGNTSIILAVAKRMGILDDKAVAPLDDPGEADKPETVNQGGRAKRIVFEFHDPKPKTIIDVDATD